MAGLDDVGPPVVDGGRPRAADGTSGRWDNRVTCAVVPLWPGGDGAVDDLLDGGWPDGGSLRTRVGRPGHHWRWRGGDEGGTAGGDEDLHRGDMEGFHLVHGRRT